MKKSYEWMSNYTGAIYETLFDAVIGTFVDWVYFPKCRSMKAFSYRKINK